MTTAPAALNGPYYIAALIANVAEQTGSTEHMSSRGGRLARIVDTGRDATIDAIATFTDQARAAALDEIHAWAWVEHAERGHVHQVECNYCGALNPPAILAFCDHGFGPDQPPAL